MTSAVEWFSLRGPFVDGFTDTKLVFQPLSPIHELESLLQTLAADGKITSAKMMLPMEEDELRLCVAYMHEDLSIDDVSAVADLLATSLELKLWRPWHTMEGQADADFRVWEAESSIANAPAWFVC